MTSPASAVFALIIGIDSYKSGSIWNLHYCVDDAERVAHWLYEDLDVPKDHVKVLTDGQACKDDIERAFRDHLVNNTAIQKGDAILVYFSGHGSQVSAPKGWYRGMRKQRTVEVLCTYDFDTRDAQGLGRVAGISDRSLHAMLNELADVKGDNITLILDTCFNPSQTPENIRERSRTRWTPAGKTSSEDLYRGLWPSARADLQNPRFGFLEPSPTKYVVLIACSPGNIAVEGREGGHFTASFLQAASSVPLHRTTYAQLFDCINRTALEEGQKAICLGKHRNRIFFDDIPFVVDGRFLAVALCTKREVRVEAGSVHGVIEGCELALHSHNYRRSRNPSLATVVVVEAHPTWSLAQIKTQDLKIPKSCWARITRWNNEPPFRVKLKASIASIVAIWRLKKELPSYALRTLRGSGVTTQAVEEKGEADISIKVQRRSVVVERHDNMGLNGSHVISLEESDAVKVINDAATFNLHLHSNNPSQPLENVIRVELHDVDGHAVSKVGPNLLNRDSKSIIHYDDRSNMAFNMVIRNFSTLPLWPYVFAMDPDIYTMALIYQPPPDFDDADTDVSYRNNRVRAPPSPLPPGGIVDVVFNWPSHPHTHLLSPHGLPYKFGYLKLLLCSNPIGSLAFFNDSQSPSSRCSKPPPPSPNSSMVSFFERTSILTKKGGHLDGIWDSFLYPVVFAMNSNVELYI